MAVDLAGPGRMLTALALGQSEHARHTHLEDGLERWLQGRASLLVTNRLLIEEDSVALLVLSPPQ